MDAGLQNNTITGNLIRDSGLCAVYLSGYCRASSSEDRRRRRLAAVYDGAEYSDEPGNDYSGGRERARLREAYHSRECVYDSFSSPEDTYVSKRNTIAHNYMVNGNLAVGGYAGIYLYESGENTIANNYIKGWFIIDLVSIFPFQLFLKDPSQAQNLKLARLCRMPRLAKLLEESRFKSILKAIDKDQGDDKKIMS